MEYTGRVLYCGYCGKPAVFADRISACVLCRGLWFRNVPINVRPCKFVMTKDDARFLRSLRIVAAYEGEINVG